MVKNIPAAMAVPITPATFGPMACIRRKFFGSYSDPTFCATLADIGTADTPAPPMRGLIFSLRKRFMIFAKRTPPTVEKAKATRPRKKINRG